MKSTKYILITGTVIVLLLGLSAFVLGQGWGKHGAVRIIMIYGDFTSGEPAVTRIEPQEIWIGRGTTVVWNNLSKNEVKILFPKGSECEKAIESKVLWKLDPRACLISGYNIPYTGTISMHFNSIGRHDYEIEYVGKDVKVKGSIVIRTEPGAIY